VHFFSFRSWNRNENSNKKKKRNVVNENVNDEKKSARDNRREIWPDSRDERL
jgi:hypothetical protein